MADTDAAKLTDVSQPKKTSKKLSTDASAENAEPVKQKESSKSKKEDKPKKKKAAKADGDADKANDSKSKPKKRKSKKEDPSSPVPQSPLTPEEDLAARMRALSMFERRVKPVEIGIELSRSTDEGQRLRTAYASLFDFCGKTLDQSLREYLSTFKLTGESQEIDRVLEAFSRRYFEQNPSDYANWDVVHTLVSSVLILNTDLYSNMVTNKMSQKDFIINTQSALNENEKVSESILKELYQSIKRKEIAVVEPASPKVSSPALTSTPETTLPGTVLIEGALHRKNVMDSATQRASNRQWKQVDCRIVDHEMCFFRAGSEFKPNALLEQVSLLHAFPSVVQGYHQHEFVLSVQLPTGGVFYCETPARDLLQQWIMAVAYAAARYSSAPLAMPQSSGFGNFIQPTMPSHLSTLEVPQQREAFARKVAEMEVNIAAHNESKGTNLGKSEAQNWEKKSNFMIGEVQKYRMYMLALDGYKGPGSAMEAPLGGVLFHAASEASLLQQPKE